MFWLFKFRWTHNTCSKFQGVTFRILFLGRKSRSFLLINAFKFWKTLMRPLDIKWTKVSFTVVLFLHMQMQELEHIIYRKEIYHKNKNIYIYIYTEKKPTCPHCRPWLGSHLIWHTSLTCARHGSSLRFYFIFLIFLNSIIEEVIWICSSMLEIPKVSKVNYKNEKSWHKNTLLLTRRCLVNKGA